MKKVLVMALFIMGFALFAQDSKFMDYVPGDSTGVGCINIKSLLKHPKLVELIDTAEKKDKDFANFSKELSTDGFDIKNAFDSVCLFFNDDASTPGGGALIQTSIPEDKLLKIIERTPDAQNMVKSVVNGKNVYRFKDVDSAKDSAMTYLSPNIIALLDSNQMLDKVITVKKDQSISTNKTIMDMVNKAGKNHSAWLVFKMKEKNPTDKTKESAETNPMFPVDEIKSGIFTLDLTGEKSDEISMKLRLSCKQAEKAQLLTMQLQGYVSIFTGMFGQSNPKLSLDIANALKFSNEGNDVLINALVTSQLIDEIKKVAEQPPQIFKPPQPGEGSGNTEEISEEIKIEEITVPATE